ncbi:hypothetical protein N7468_009182 [Penicillium chermesinum]|uniref:NAD(P)-binding domain-containing protein n=1 Tax=Penicillium chermesinum TaxID=63820 RepID=A0A9W9TES1_9EURO|nr:uncharacterized protein N7468_009182 [Penicillium chermesinum]KAJ5219978.1 hypothetical protein N7468_009182 [Penicillium chermesinum]KAJ6157435.1 hypothetical protein N7470_005027 [Penicillium chermesinum]
MGSPKTIAFLGASSGVGLSALKHCIATGHKCIALARMPSKFEEMFPAGSQPNLKIVKGNAHDIDTVSQCITADDSGTQLVDIVITTIGSRPTAKLTLEDPDVCEKGSASLVTAIKKLRSEGLAGNPYIIACSTTGMSKHGRDFPLALYPVYAWLLKAPHADKEVMERNFMESGLPWTFVRPALLTSGATTKMVRVGVEDPKNGFESKEIGYFISREDTGKWIVDYLVNTEDNKYMYKFPSLTTG